MLLRLIPNIFYADIKVGLDLFVRYLGFEVFHQGASIYVLARDGAKVYLMENADLAAMDRPELAIETDDIAGIYTEIQTRAPEILHPNSNTVQRKPWGAQEFAALHCITVCVVSRQW